MSTSRRNTTIVIAVIVGAGILFAFCVIAAALLMSGGFALESGGDIALIRVEGLITAGRGSSGILGDGSAGSERIVSLLERFRQDDAAQAVVIRINSPGGSAAGSQEIYQQIMRVRKDGKKVIVSMGDVAASGGYYVASAADKIYADPATLTGSIGVIMETADLHELLDRVGVDMTTIKSGKHKDIGSMSRPMTPEEKAILQNVIDDVYDQFVSDVVAGRKKLTKPELLKLADGRVFTGRQAAKLKLVDEMGGLEDATKAAARAVGITGEYSVVEYEKPAGLMDILLGRTDVQLPAWLRGRASLSDFANRLLHVDAELSLR